VGKKNGILPSPYPLKVRRKGDASKEEEKKWNQRGEKRKTELLSLCDSEKKNRGRAWRVSSGVMPRKEKKKKGVKQRGREGVEKPNESFTAGGGGGKKKREKKGSTPKGEKGEGGEGGRRERETRCMPWGREKEEKVKIFVILKLRKKNEGLWRRGGGYL